MYRSRALMTLTVSAAVALSACSSDSTGPGDQLTDQQMSADVAASSGPELASGVTLLADAETVGSGLASVVPASACTVQAKDGLITFSSESHPDTIQYNVTWQYFAAGVCQNMFVRASTDSIAFTALLHEADNDPRFVAHANRNWVIDVTGSPTLASATTPVAFQT